MPALDRGIAQVLSVLIRLTHSTAFLLCLNQLNSHHPQPERPKQAFERQPQSPGPSRVSFVAGRLNDQLIAGQTSPLELISNPAKPAVQTCLYVRPPIGVVQTTLVRGAFVRTKPRTNLHLGRMPNLDFPAGSLALDDFPLYGPSVAQQCQPSNNPGFAESGSAAYLANAQLTVGNRLNNPRAGFLVGRCLPRVRACLWLGKACLNA